MSNIQQVKCWPLLYARTLNVDFNSKYFLRMPDFFSSVEEDSFFDFICHATKRSEMVRRRERVIVIGNSRHTVLGRVVDFHWLAKRVLGEEEVKQHRYLRVDNEKTGRSAWGFIGVVVKAGSGIEPFEISDKNFLDLYENTIKGCWDNKRFDIDGRRVSESMNLNVKTIELNGEQNAIAEEFTSAMDMKSGGNLRDTTRFEKNDENHNLAAIYYAFKRAMGGEKISLCTELPYLDTKYDIVTCEDPARMVANLAKKKIDEQRLSSSQGFRYDVRKNEVSLLERLRESFKKGGRELVDRILPNFPNFLSDSSKNIPNMESSDTWQGNKRYCYDVNDLSKVYSAPKSKKNFEIGDAVMTCVAAGGAVITAVAISCKANLFLIGLSGAFTVVVTAAEALRILEKLDDNSKY